MRPSSNKPCLAAGAHRVPADLCLLRPGPAFPNPVWMIVYAASLPGKPFLMLTRLGQQTAGHTLAILTNLVMYANEKMYDPRGIAGGQSLADFSNDYFLPSYFWLHLTPSPLHLLFYVCFHFLAGSAATFSLLFSGVNVRWCASLGSKGRGRSWPPIHGWRLRKKNIHTHTEQTQHEAYKGNILYYL